MKYRGFSFDDGEKDGNIFPMKTQVLAVVEGVVAPIMPVRFTVLTPSGDTKEQINGLRFFSTSHEDSLYIDWMAYHQLYLHLSMPFRTYRYHSV